MGIFLIPNLTHFYQNGVNLTTQCFYGIVSISNTMLNKQATSSTNDNVILVHSGEDYFTRLEQMILDAKTEIHIQTYIFDYDTIGKKIISAVQVAALRNVKIYILLDGFGSFSFPEVVINDLKKIGVHLRFFSPLFSANSLYIGRRLHHKIVVSDGKKALIGGINIADKYHGPPPTAPWLDYAVIINDENIAKPLQELCRNIYAKKRIIRKKEIKFSQRTTQASTISILQNDWLLRKNEIYTTYLKNISNAQKEIVIVGSYFLPGKKLIKSLKKASLKGVKIKLILSGISDVPMARRASCHLYSKFLRNNIELYEWKSSVLHGKTAVIDSNWTTIGSFNMNNLSSFASIEMNVGINSPEFATTYLAHLQEIMGQCESITPVSLQIRAGSITKLVNWLSYWITRAIEIIVTYLPQKRF